MQLTRAQGVSMLTRDEWLQVLLLRPKSMHGKLKLRLNFRNYKTFTARTHVFGVWTNEMKKKS